MCDVCYGIGVCPVCSDDPNYIDCPECNGEGYIYYDINGEEISRKIYDLLPPSERFSDKCDKCNGLGEVPEPEYNEFES